MSDGATVSYAPNDLNQYRTVNGSSVGYGPSGNLTSYGGWTYSHDADNRLISAIGGGHTVTFVYDGLGRCMQRTIDGVTTTFSYDGWQAIAEWSELGSRDIDGWAGRPSERARASQWDSAGVRTAWNMYGPGPDEILARYRASDASYLHYHSDQFGNVKFLLDGSNVGKEKYSYDAYGAPTVTDWDGSNTRSTSNYGNRFMFNGREYLSEANVYDYRARAYSPELGRFLQPDPIGFGGDPVNLYRYCANNPVNWSDPMGLDVEQVTHPQVNGFDHWYAGVTDAASGGAMHYFDFYPKGNPLFSAGAWDDHMSVPNDSHVEWHHHTSPEQDLVVLNALYRSQKDPPYYSILGRECQVRSWQVIDNALGAERWNFDPVDHYTGNIFDAQWNYAGWEDPDTGNIYNADGKWAGYNPKFRETFGNTWGSFRVGLSSGEASYLGFQGADGFGGGGGLGPPGGMEQAVWDNMHKKKKSE